MITETVPALKQKFRSSLNSHDRRAKIQDNDFVCGLLQAVATAGDQFSLADLRQSVCQFTGVEIVQSTFNERMRTDSLVLHLKDALKTVMTSISSQNHQNHEKLLKKLGVSQIIGIDGSMVSLWDGLAKEWPGTFVNASAKLHLATDLLTGAVSWLDLTDGKTHDSLRFPDCQTNALYLFDLGYWSSDRFQSINDNNAFFFTRIKSGIKLTVKKIVEGRIGKHYVEGHLPELARGLTKRSNIVELMVEDPKTGSEYRAIGMWNQPKRCYHWYITNLELPAKELKNLYRLRWQIELTFKALKSTLKLDHIPSLSSNTVTSLIFASITNYALSVALRIESKATAKGVSKKATLQRAVKAYRIAAEKFMSFLRLSQNFTVARDMELKALVKSTITRIFDSNYKTEKDTVSKVYRDLGLAT